MCAISQAVAQQTETALHNAAVTATANSTGVDISAFEGLIALNVRIPLVSGTSPTLDITVQTSDALASGYASAVKNDNTTATLTQFTAAGAQRIILDTAALKKYVRLAFTAGGTTPSFATSAYIVGVNRVV